jgi:hypothetical protein
MAGVAANPAAASNTLRVSAEAVAAPRNLDPLLPALEVESTAPAELDLLCAPVLNPAAHEKFVAAGVCEPAARWVNSVSAVRDIAYELPAIFEPVFAFQPVQLAKARSFEASWIRPVAALATAAAKPTWRGVTLPPVEQTMRIPSAVPAGATEAAPVQAERASYQPLLEIPPAKPVNASADIPGGVPGLRIPALPDPEKILPKGSAPSPAARPANSLPVPNGDPRPMFAPPLTPQHKIAAAQTASLRLAPSRPLEARPAFPPPMLWNPNVAVLEAIPPRLFRPATLVFELNSGVGEGDFIELDFYLQRGSGRPAEGANWITPVVGLMLPELTLRKINEREASAPVPIKEPPKEKEPEKVKIIEVPKRKRPAALYGARIAACLVAGFALWLSAHLLRMSTAPSDGDVADSTQQSAGAHTEVATATEAAAQQGWFRRTIRERAAVQVGDSFQGGMKSWGADQGSFASGWSRSADGYIRPGALALFQPTLNFTDYRLEFNGQIENKAMDWVVRARDTNNYYGMKLSVVDPGLRPVLSIAHYAVVDGHKGNKVELPLVSVMVHRNTPLQVAVDVKGRRVTTSIDGEEVDSWTDTALARGGVGFFSEAGERSRIYWMKVSKNQDWIGSICSYLSGGSGQTAEVRGPAIPGIPQPAAPSRREDVAVVPESLQYRRYGRWNS